MAHAARPDAAVRLRDNRQIDEKRRRLALMADFTQEGQEDRIGTFFNGSFACDDVQHTSMNS